MVLGTWDEIATFLVIIVIIAMPGPLFLLVRAGATRMRSCMSSEMRPTATL